MHKIINSICSNCGNLAQNITTTQCCEVNEYITIPEFIDKWKEDQKSTKWPENFTNSEFEDFVKDEIDDDFIIELVDDRDLYNDICDCEECEECDCADYPDSRSLTMNQKSALDYFVEHIEIFTVEHLESLKKIIER